MEKNTIEKQIVLEIEFLLHGEKMESRRWNSSCPDLEQLML
jgi:hypothetical protein